MLRPMTCVKYFIKIYSSVCSLRFLSQTIMFFRYPQVLRVYRSLCSLRRSALISDVVLRNCSLFCEVTRPCYRARGRLTPQPPALTSNYDTLHEQLLFWPTHCLLWDADPFVYCASWSKTNMNEGECRMNIAMLLLKADHSSERNIH